MFFLWIIIRIGTASQDLPGNRDFANRLPCNTVILQGESGKGWFFSQTVPFFPETNPRSAGRSASQMRIHMTSGPAT
jgi:uncharacterized protein (DUF302 family)